MSLEENIKLVKDNMVQASIKSSLSQCVNLVAVTKTVPSETAKKLVDLGINHLAENRPEKLIEKQEALKDQSGITWHLIGTLQTRKIKDVINRIDYFHALDRIKTAQEIQNRATKEIKCFVQVNVSGELTKQGILLEDVEGFINELAFYPSIKVVGLMTMAPYGESVDKIRAYFSKLAKQQQQLASLKLKHAPCTELSMGMSNDYSIAIEEGATFIRVGSRLFE